jgi:hypothetical protein
MVPSDNAQQQEHRENYHLCVFSQLHSLPGQQLSRNVQQKPDFLFKQGDRTFGIEHTELKKTRSSVDTPSVAKLKGTQRNIVRKAMKMAQGASLPPMQVIVWFHDNFFRYPQGGREAALALFRVIKCNLDLIEATESTNSIEIAPPEPSVGISQIYARIGRAFGKKWLDEQRWLVSELGFVTFDFAAELQTAIDNKNVQIDAYLSNCDECWLLVVADRFRGDQRYELTDKLEQHTFVSMFHRTFFLEVVFRLLKELHTQPPE